MVKNFDEAVKTLNNEEFNKGFPKYRKSAYHDLYYNDKDNFLTMEEFMRNNNCFSELLTKTINHEDYYEEFKKQFNKVNEYFNDYIETKSYSLSLVDAGVEGYEKLLEDEIYSLSIKYIRERRVFASLVMNALEVCFFLKKASTIEDVSQQVLGTEWVYNEHFYDYLRNFMFNHFFSESESIFLIDKRKDR